VIKERGNAFVKLMWCGKDKLRREEGKSENKD